MLIRGGAQVDLRDRDGQTAVMKAKDDDDMLKVLVENEGGLEQPGKKLSERKTGLL